MKVGPRWLTWVKMASFIYFIHSFIEQILIACCTNICITLSVPHPDSLFREMHQSPGALSMGCQKLAPVPWPFSENCPQQRRATLTLTTDPFCRSVVRIQPSGATAWCSSCSIGAHGIRLRPGHPQFWCPWPSLSTASLGKPPSQANWGGWSPQS